MAGGAFVAALGGMRANQSWIDVIGNNLANSNTPGFKGSRTLFADLISITRRPATAPAGSVGGTNPSQVGLGVRVGDVQRSVSQGSLNQTGRTFDLALLGDGFFAVTSGTETLYSRVGSFGLDGNGTMVDQRTGYQVLDRNGQSFTIDQAAVYAPQPTANVGFTGNLPAVVSGPLAEVLNSNSSYKEGVAAVMTGASAGDFNIPVGETWTMEFVVNGGAPESLQIVGNGNMTAQEVADEINNQIDHVNATVDASQQIVLTSDIAGSGSTIKVNAGEVAKDLKAMLGLGDFVQGVEFAATLASDLNDLTTNTADYVTGDVIDVTGTDVDGSAVVASFVYGVDGTTVGDLTTYLDGLFGQSTVAFNDTTGQISVTADVTGEANLSLLLADRTSQAGASDWSSNFFAVTTNGTGPDTVTTSMEVFDSTGAGHVLTFTYTRQDDGSWEMDATVPPGEGSVVSGQVSGIQFNANGSLLTPSTAQISVQFGALGAQTIDLDLGVSGSFEGLTQFGSPASTIADFQDGFGAGELASLAVNIDGEVQGFYTNGQTQALGDFGIATFTNQLGLEVLADGYQRVTANAGQRIFGAADAAGAGQIISGSIEASNVDTAEEFVHLIQAQRGFQANARVISVQDEIFSETVNII